MYQTTRRNSTPKSLRNAEHRIDTNSFKNNESHGFSVDFNQIRVEIIDLSSFSIEFASET